jgi:glycerol-3-phosphate dehydrogenase
VKCPSSLPKRGRALHSPPKVTERRQHLQALAANKIFDLIIVGGGATGLGLALDAQARGLQVALFEAQDFASGTSSRSTKLLHGGVRYLAQGKLGLVVEALQERTTLLRNAPHVAQPLAFVMPCYKAWEAPFYGCGLKLYDLLAGKAGLGPTQWLAANNTIQSLPGVSAKGLKGGVQFWDGQFDDARLAIALARTAAARGATLVNYCRVESLLYEGDRVQGVQARDSESGRLLAVRAACVVNASGVWVDALRQQDAVTTQRTCAGMVAPSQGVHLVVDSRFLPGDKALLIPSTEDGRVLFAVPWQGKVILGTTDTPRSDLPMEPQAYPQELDFILREAGRYLATPPQRQDVRSVWVGLRPLVTPGPSRPGTAGSTQKISREHTVESSVSGLVSVTGGKWTTYRAIAEDVLEHCFDQGLLARSPHGVTTNLRLIGAGQERDASQEKTSLTAPPGAHLYGSEADFLAQLPGHDTWIAPGLSQAMVRFAARYEFARSTHDMLARRSRLLFLDAALAIQAAPQVAEILAQETGVDPQLDAFLTLARHYLLDPSSE